MFDDGLVVDTSTSTSVPYCTSTPSKLEKGVSMKLSGLTLKFLGSPRSQGKRLATYLAHAIFDRIPTEWLFTGFDRSFFDYKAFAIPCTTNCWTKTRQWIEHNGFLGLFKMYLWHQIQEKKSTFHQRNWQAQSFFVVGYTSSADQTPKRQVQHQFVPLFLKRAEGKLNASLKIFQKVVLA